LEIDEKAYFNSFVKLWNLLFTHFRPFGKLAYTQTYGWRSNS